MHFSENLNNFPTKFRNNAFTELHANYVYEEKIMLFFEKVNKISVNCKKIFFNLNNLKKYAIIIRD